MLKRGGGGGEDDAFDGQRAPRAPAPPWREGRSRSLPGAFWGPFGPLLRPL